MLVPNHWISIPPFSSQRFFFVKDHLDLLVLSFSSWILFFDRSDSIARYESNQSTSSSAIDFRPVTPISLFGWKDLPVAISHWSVDCGCFVRFGLVFNIFTSSNSICSFWNPTISWSSPPYWSYSSRHCHRASTQDHSKNQQLTGKPPYQGFSSPPLLFAAAIIIDLLYSMQQFDFHLNLLHHSRTSKKH